MLYPILNSLYGQLRGYDRWSIRRDVSANAMLSLDDLSLLSRELLDSRLLDAVAKFPSYAKKVRGCCGRLPTLKDSIPLSALPVWTREDQQALFDELSGPPVVGSFVHSTGGSTGQPRSFYVSRESYEWRSAVSDRGYSWAGAEEGRSSVYVWGAPVNDPGLHLSLKKRLHHGFQRRRYFDSFYFDDEQKQRCCNLIDSVQPDALVGYAGNLVELAGAVRDNKSSLKWKTRSIVTAAEGLFSRQRELLEATIADEVFMSYGSREFMLIGMECSEHNGYHISADNIKVEVVDESGELLPPGEIGHLLVTDLRNSANPFIRYEIGDLGSLSDSVCRCGKPFPLLKSVDGRMQEFIEMPDGSRLTALFIPHVMKDFSWVDGYQVCQKKDMSIVFNIVSSEPFDDENVKPIALALKAHLSDGVHISFPRVAALRKNRSGKTPIVVSDL